MRISVAILIAAASIAAAAETVAPGNTAPSAPPAPLPAPAPAAKQTFAARVRSVSKDGKELRVDRNGQTVFLSVKRLSLQEQAKDLREGDGLMVETVPAAAGDAELTDFRYELLAPQPPAWQRVGVMILAGLGLFVLAAIATRGQPVRGLLIGKDNRFSNSQTQMVLWFAALLIAYVAILSLRWTHQNVVGWVGIPTNLLMLSGLSAFSFAAAKGITERKDAATAAAGQTKQPSTTPTTVLDLARDDAGKFDLGDLQMILLAVIAVMTFLFQVYEFGGNLDGRVRTSLPDVDSTILASFGLGQGAYLIKKSVSGIES